MFFDKKNNKIISNNVGSPQNEKPRVFREMVSYVPVDENGNKIGRSMAEIVDNSKKRIICNSDMCHYIDTSVPFKPLVPQVQEYEIINPQCSLPAVPMFFSDSSFVYESGMLFHNNVPFLNCTIEIMEIVQSETQDYFRCRIYLKGEYIIKDVKNTDFLSGKWLSSVTGCATFGDRSVAYKHLNEYLDFLVHNLDLSNKSKLYQKPGWQIIDNKYYYITPQGVIDGQSIKAKSECGQNFTSLEPDFSAFGKYLNAINITSSNVATILVLYTAMSLCNFLFKKATLTPRFSLFVYGYRGNYKTSLSLILSQICYKDTPTFSFKGTAAGIESGFRDYKDSIILVDDLSPSNIDKRKMQMNLETVLRAFGDGVAHRRCILQHNDDKATKIGQYEAEGGCIFTGEHTNLECESSLARCLFVELKKEDVNLDLLSSAQDDRLLVEKFTVCFVSCLTRLINDYGVDIIKFIEKRGKEIRKKFSFKYSNERFGEYQSNLQTVSELLLFVASYFNLLSSQEISMYSERFSNAILEVIEANNTRLVAQNPTTVLCESLKNAIEDEKIPYCPLGSVVPDYDKVIFHKEEYLYLSQKCCAAIVNGYIRDNDINLAEFTSTRVASTLENSHIISVTMEGTTKRYGSKLKGYGSKRFMRISLPEFKKHVSF